MDVVRDSDGVWMTGDGSRVPPPRLDGVAARRSDEVSASGDLVSSGLAFVFEGRVRELFFLGSSWDEAAVESTTFRFLVLEDVVNGLLAQPRGDARLSCFECKMDEDCQGGFTLCESSKRFLLDAKRP